MLTLHYLIKVRSIIFSLQDKLFELILSQLYFTGSFVALSTIRLPQEFEDPIPFELKTGVNKFFTYVVDTSNSRPIIESTLINLKGAIKFSSDNTKFIVCDVHNTRKKLLYIFSTRNWKLGKKNLSGIYDKFTISLQSIYHPWDQVKFLKNSLLGDHFICVENVSITILALKRTWITLDICLINAFT